MTVPTGSLPEPAGRPADLPTFRITDPLQVGTTTLLEASAGTGKTWTIASLVTRYVAEGVCQLDEMLVVTFGRAASQELRQRVREQLVAASRWLARAGLAAAEPPVPEPGLGELAAVLLTDDPAELEERRRRLRSALADFDSATIATTHQFCHQVLDSLGVAGDTDPRARLVDDLDDLLVEVVDDLYVADHGAGADVDDAPGSAPPMSRSEALALARDVVGDPQARLEPVDAGAGGRVHARVDFARRVRAELDRRKRRLGVLGYDDLLSQLATALEDATAPARARMRERWRVVLVDEFQDTDPVQWQVLDRAFSGVATMVLIGDPKQAIYAFRGGDIVTYLAAQDTAARTATLGTNQRSDAPLVTSLLAVLRGAALGDARILVREVDAYHQGGRLVGAPHPEPFRLRLADRYTLGVEGHKPVPINDLRRHVAADLAADVVALLSSGATFDGRPLLPRDVAVLCRTTSQCHTAQAALEAAGVRTVHTGSGSVFRPDAPGAPALAASVWLTLLEALEQPHRTARVRAAALTPFFGLTASELDAGGNPLTDAVAETVRDWATLLRARGVAAVLEAASSDGRLAHRVLSAVGGERLMTDLRHAGEALHAAASRDDLGIVALLAWLREQMSDEHLAVASERARRLDSDASAVQILTVHVSKGLQFPVVYLPGVSDLWVGDTPRTLRYHDDAGHRCLDVGGDPTSAVVARVRHEELAEELRVLYVALTRAQSQVVAWWLPSPRNTASSPLHRVLYGRGPGDAEVPDAVPVPDDRTAIGIARQWAGVGGPVVEPARIAASAPPAAASGASVLAVRRFDRRVDDAWSRTSYSRLSTAAADAGQPEEQLALAATSEPESVPRDDEGLLVTEPLRAQGPPGAPEVPTSEAVESPMARLPVGATFGSLVHAVLEHADPAAPERRGDWRAELRHHVDEQLVLWPVDLGEGGRDLLVEALVAVCATPLGPLAPTTLAGVSAADRLCELDFELPLAGGDDPEAVRRVGVGGTVRDLASLLRRHLPHDDPLAAYADVVDDPAYEQALRGYLSGSLDLVMRVGGRYVVCDYKTNWLGPLDDRADGPPLTSEPYRPERLAAAMGHSSYPLQALLYAVVLHRFLRWRVRDYEPETHLGGVLYLYVRGMCGPETPVVDGESCGVFSWRPPVALVEALSDLLDGDLPDPLAVARPDAGATR